MSVPVLYVIKKFKLSHNMLIGNPFLEKKPELFLSFVLLNSELFSVFSSVYRGTFQILQGLVQETDGQVGNVSLRAALPH